MIIAILAVSLAIACLGIYSLIRNRIEDLAPAPIREPSYVASSLRIVAIMLREYLRSIPALLLVLSLVLTMLLSSVTTTYSLVETRMSFTPSIEMKSFVTATSIDVVKKLEDRENASYLAIVHIYGFARLCVDSRCRDMLPLILVCRGSTGCSAIDRICRALEKCDALIHGANSVVLGSIELDSKPIELRVCGTDLSKAMSIEVLPNTYLAHSLGVLGGRTLVLSDPRALVILSPRFLRYVSDQPIRITVVSSSSDLPKIVGEDVDTFGYYQNGTLIVESRSLVPTARSFLSLGVSILIAMVIGIAVSSSLIERIAMFSRVLIVQGTTMDLIKVSASIALFLLLSCFGVPTAIAIYFTQGPLPSASSILTLLTVSLGLSATTLKRLETIHIARVEEPLTFERSYVFEKKMPINDLVECLRRGLAKDDFFEAGELEILETGRGYLVRVELYYRMALALIASVEMAVEERENSTLVELYSYVWSYEEVERKRIASVAYMALSKVSGVLRVCMES